MRTEEIEIYTFDELSEESKEKARAWYRRGLEYPWFDECLSSLSEFCDTFSVKVTDYYLSDCYRASISTDATHKNFRGFKLKDFDRESMPTGFCFDSDLRYAFYDDFKRTGNAFLAFENAIEKFLQSVRNDIEWHSSNEAVDENIIANEYEFTIDGQHY